MALPNDARDLLIRTIYGEASGEGPQGWLAVAHVIKNRVDSGAWGPGLHILPVIHAPHQFSMYEPNDPNGPRANALNPNDSTYQRIGQIVDAAFGGQSQDPTFGATHFFNPQSVHQFPPWAADGSNVRQIGNHLFMTVPLNMNSTAGTILPTYRPAGHDQEDSHNETDGPGGYDVQHMDQEFLARIAKLRDDAAAIGVHTKVLSAYRDTAKQTLLRQNYEAKLAGRPIPHPEVGDGGVAAVPGGSYHNYGRAMDVIAVDANGKFDPVGQQKLVALADQPERGIAAGAHFKTTPDLPHFQAAEGTGGELKAIASGYVGPSTLEMSAGRPGANVTTLATPPSSVDTSVYGASPLGPAATVSNPLARVNTAGTDATLGGGVSPGAPPAVNAYAGGATTAPAAQNSPAGAVGAPRAVSADQNPRFPLLTFGGGPGGRNPEPAYVSSMNLANLIYGAPASAPAPLQSSTAPSLSTGPKASAAAPAVAPAAAPAEAQKWANSRLMPTFDPGVSNENAPNWLDALFKGVVPGGGPRQFPRASDYGAMGYPALKSPFDSS